MKVKIGDEWHDSTEQPVLVVLEESEIDTVCGFAIRGEREIKLFSAPQHFTYDAAYVQEWIKS